MRRILPAIVLMAILTGCSHVTSQIPSKQDVGTLIKTATGTVKTLQQNIQDTVEYGKIAIDEAKKQADAAASRARLIQEGVQRMQEGQQLVKEGITGTGAKK
jgi:hypothetical protein